jgi:hypothetical protein
MCILTITVMLLCWRIIKGPPKTLYTHLDQMWFGYGPAMIASGILLPFVTMDIVRMSNRFVGPLIRLRRAMRALARGEHVDPISFREGDFWLECAQEFNAVLARVQRQPQSIRTDSAPENPTATEPVHGENE